MEKDQPLVSLLVRKLISTGFHFDPLYLCFVYDSMESICLLVYCSICVCRLFETEHWCCDGCRCQWLRGTLYSINTFQNKIVCRRRCRCSDDAMWHGTHISDNNSLRRDNKPHRLQTKINKVNKSCLVAFFFSLLFPTSIFLVVLSLVGVMIVSFVLGMCCHWDRAKNTQTRTHNDSRTNSRHRNTLFKMHKTTISSFLFFLNEFFFLFVSISIFDCWKTFISSFWMPSLSLSLIHTQ